MTEPIYSPINPEHAADPYERLAHLRAQCPVYQPWENTWVVASDAIARDVLRDSEAFSSYQNGTLVPMPDDELILSQLDPPRHTRIRGFFREILNPKAVASLEPWITETCVALVRGFAADGGTDLVANYAAQVPGAVTMRVLGMAPDRLPDITQWVDDYFTNCIFGQDAVRSWPECAAYLDGLIASRRGASDAPDDFLQRLISAEIDGETLTDLDIRNIMFIFFAGGVETTANHIALLVLRLVENNLWETVREDRELVDKAIEESLRMDPPTVWMMRTATRPATLAGSEILEGDRLFVSFQSANRDDEKWDQPNDFSLGRAGGRDHLTFSSGRHLCVGAPLARLEARVALNVLLDWFPQLEVSQDFHFEKTPSFMLYGLRSLPVRFAPASEPAVAR